MNRIRMAALAALTVGAVSLGAAGTASAAQGAVAAPLTKSVAMTGTKHFKGKYTIDRFATRNGKLVAVGTLTGTMRKQGKTKRVSKNGVVMPAAATGAGPSGSPAKTSQVLPTSRAPARCSTSCSSRSP